MSLHETPTDLFLLFCGSPPFIFIFILRLDPDTDQSKPARSAQTQTISTPTVLVAHTPIIHASGTCATFTQPLVKAVAQVQVRIWSPLDHDWLTRVLDDLDIHAIRKTAIPNADTVQSRQVVSSPSRPKLSPARPCQPIHASPGSASRSRQLSSFSARLSLLVDGVFPHEHCLRH